VRLVSSGQGLDDGALVRRALAGDRAAPALLFDRYAPHVARVLRQVLGSGDHADLVSDVFLRALDRLHRLDRLDEEGALMRWLTRIAVFTARERLRSERRRRWLLFFPPDEAPIATESCGQTSALETLEARECVRRLFAVLERFPVDERLVFSLRYLHEMELTEVADACGISIAVCKRRLARAATRFVPLARRDPTLRTWLERGTRWSTP
jgi:RNA polymerase sigma-70 factor (ECF subfamily)